MKQYILHLIWSMGLFLIAALPAFAQIEIKGQVFTKGGDAIDGAIVAIKSVADSTLLNYFLTDENGLFELATNSSDHEIFLEVKQMGFHTHWKRLKNVSQTVQVVLEPTDEFDLSEVVIDAKSIVERGDTISYLMQMFSSEGDKSIREALERMPGIKVSPSGAISYNGKAISEFQIEGMDLFEGKYGIAVERIRPEDIASVEIMRDFQPLKVLQDSRPTDDVALNLKLRNNAKNILTGDSEVQVGIEEQNNWLYQLGLIASLFNSQHQSFLTLEGNNNGSNPIRTYTDHTLSAMSATPLTSISIPSVPSLSETRYRHNRSEAISYHGASRLPKEAKLKYNALWVGDRNKGEYVSEDLYRLSEGGTVKNRYDFATNKGQKLGELGLNYQQNRDNLFVANRLLMRFNQDKPSTNVSGHIQATEEATIQDKSFINRFRLIKKFGDVRGVDFIFITHYQDQTEELNIYPLGIQHEVYAQEVSSKSLNIDLRAELLSTFRLGKLIIDPYGFITIYKTVLGSHLSAPSTSLPLDLLKGDVDYGLYRSGLGLSFHYNYKILNFEGYVPVMYWLVDIERTPDDLKSNLLRIAPNVSIRTNLTKGLTLVLSAEATSFFNPVEDFIQSIILQNSYKMTQAKMNDVAEKRQRKIQAKIDYSNIFQRLFGSLYLNYDNLHADMISNIILDEGRIKVEQTPYTFDTHRLSSGGDLSKSFVSTKGLIGLGGNYTKVRSTSMHNSTLIPFTTDSYQFYLKGHVKAFKWLDINGRADWIELTSHQENSSKPLQQQHLFLRGSMLLNFGNGFTATLSDEYSHSFKPYKSVANLMDFSVQYKRGRTIFSLNFNNITNSQLFETYSIGSSASSYSAYHLRPRSVMVGVKTNLL